MVNVSCIVLLPGRDLQCLGRERVAEANLVAVRVALATPDSVSALSSCLYTDCPEVNTMHIRVEVWAHHIDSRKAIG